MPELTVLEIDRRLVPGESPEAARDEVIARIAAACGRARIEHEPPFLESAGLPDGTGCPAVGPWVSRLAEAARRVGGGRRVAARYGTNASILAAAGVPAIVFGPGSIEQAHTADEWIDLAQLDAAAGVLRDVVANAAGG